MQTVCIILSLNILRGQIAKGVKISKGFRFNLNLQNILGHSMVTANLNKSEDFVTNTTAASKYITSESKKPGHIRVVIHYWNMSRFF